MNRILLPVIIASHGHFAELLSSSRNDEDVARLVTLFLQEFGLATTHIHAPALSTQPVVAFLTLMLGRTRLDPTWTESLEIGNVEMVGYWAALAEEFETNEVPDGSNGIFEQVLSILVDNCEYRITPAHSKDTFIAICEHLTAPVTLNLLLPSLAALTPARQESIIFAVRCMREVMTARTTPEISRLFESDWGNVGTLISQGWESRQLARGLLLLTSSFAEAVPASRWQYMLSYSCEALGLPDEGIRHAAAGSVRGLCLDAPANVRIDKSLVFEGVRQVEMSQMQGVCEGFAVLAVKSGWGLDMLAWVLERVSRHGDFEEAIPVLLSVHRGFAYAGSVDEAVVVLDSDVFEGGDDECTRQLWSYIRTACAVGNEQVTSVCVVFALSRHAQAACSLVSLSQMDPMPGFTPTLAILMEFMSWFLSRDVLFSCQVTVATSIASRYGKTGGEQLPADFLTGVVWRSCTYLHNLHGCTENPDIVSSLCGYLNVLVDEYPGVLLSICESSWGPLVMECLKIEERFALKALLGFLARLAAAGDSCKPASVGLLGSRILQSVMENIAGQAALSMLPDFSTVLYRWVHRELANTLIDTARSMHKIPRRFYARFSPGKNSCRK
ncbi:MAG: hypothetical protein SGCHY_003254 [Lobulomycetales sp.]